MPRNARSDKRRGRYDKRALATLLPKAFPERLREALEPQLDDYVTELVWDMKNRTIDTGGRELATNSAHRTAIDVLPRIMKAVGSDEESVARFIASTGAADATEIFAAMAMYRAVQGRNAVDIYRECRRMVDWCEGPDGPPEVAAILEQEGTKRARVGPNGDGNVSEVKNGNGTRS